MDLLQPSLDKESSATIYSSTALFLTAFIGGAYAVILLSTLNSERLDQLRSDLSKLLICFFITVVALSAFEIYMTISNIDNGLSDSHLANRIIGISLFFYFYNSYRVNYRLREKLNRKSPDYEWLATLGCIITGISLSLITTWSVNEYLRVG